MAAPCAFKGCFGLLSVGHPVLPWMGLSFHHMEGMGRPSEKGPKRGALSRGMNLVGRGGSLTAEVEFYASTHRRAIVMCDNVDFIGIAMWIVERRVQASPRSKG